MKKLIIYHSEDNDGLFSAAIAREAEMEAYHFTPSTDSVDFLGINYSEAKELENGRLDKYEMIWSPSYICHDYNRVILVDFSFSVETMKYFFEIFGDNFIWCDHHAPVIKAVYDAGLSNIAGIRAAHGECSAIKCTWDYYFNPAPLPMLLDILQQYDSWTYSKKDKELVVSVNLGVQVKTGLDFFETVNVLDEVLENQTMDVYDAEIGIRDVSAEQTQVNDFRAIGKDILSYRTFTNETIIENFGDCTFNVNGRAACLVTYAGATGSDMFASLSETNIMNGIVLKRMKNSEWTVSVYNLQANDDFHCGEYLRKNYNGGGHAGAAGCQMTDEQVIKLLSTRTL